MKHIFLTLLELFFLENMENVYGTEPNAMINLGKHSRSRTQKEHNMILFGVAVKLRAT